MDNENELNPFQGLYMIRLQSYRHYDYTHILYKEKQQKTTDSTNTLPISET